jgi:eukaryotic-like serine/threonine-protein kinase
VSSQARLVAGRFRTIRRLGAGAMASVYLAEDCELGRMVAIKRLHPESSAEVAPRFRREMRVAASLSHPHIVTLYDAIVDDEAVLLVMEYVDGPTLAERLRDGAFDPQQAIARLRELADAVDHLHRQGVIHRDIKPANVLLDRDGRVKLTDLGIASAAQATGITTEGTILGTPAYMAPELFEGERARPAADVYSVAAIAYEMLTGRRAREGGTPAVMALRAASEEPPDLRDLRPDAPALADALQRGMARSPGDRPETATAFVDELASALERDGAGETAAAVAAAPTASTAPAAPAPQATSEIEVARPSGDGASPEPGAGGRAPAGAVDRGPARDRRDGGAAAAGASLRPATRMGASTLARRSSGARALLLAALLLAGAAVAAVVVAGTGGGDGSRSAQRTTSSGSGERTSSSRRTTSSADRSTATGAAGTSTASTSSGVGPTSTSTAPASSGAGGTTGAPAAAGAGGAGAETPEGAVQSFYGLAAQHRYEDAWALAAPSLRSQLGGFDAFRSQFSSVRSIDFRRAETVQKGDSTATVAIATTATHTDRVDRCTGTAQTTAREGGGWQVARLSVSC